MSQILHIAFPWIAGQFVNAVPAGLVFALLAWLLLRAFGRGSSSMRFAVWYSALLAIVALPFLSSIAAKHLHGRAAGSAVSLSAGWGTALILLWMTFAAIELGRLALAVWNLRKLIVDCRPIDPDSLDPMLRQTLGEFQYSRKIPRKIVVAVSRHVSTPAAIGFFKPMILLPPWAMRELSPEQLNAILIHEFTHLQRWDDWTQLAQRIIRALLFFHPAVWWIDKELSLEREIACDDAVLTRTGNARAYADCLVSLAEKRLARRGLAFVNAAVSKMREISRRVTHILSGHRPVASSMWKPAMSTIALLTVVGASWLARTPEWIVFRDSAHAAPSVVMAVDSASAHPLVQLAANQIDSVKMDPAKLAKGNAKVVLTKASSAKTRSVSRLVHSAAVVSPTKPMEPWWNVPQTQMAAVSLIPSETVYVVVSAEQVDSSGSDLWTVCVWRVIVVNSEPMENRIPASKI